MAIYFSLDIINRNDPNAFSYNSFIEDAGIISVNSSGLFHFISMGTLLNNFEIYGVNFKDFIIIWFEESSEKYLQDKDLYGRNHWLYGQCNNKSDTEGIGYLIDYSFFESLLVLESIIVLKIRNIMIQVILNLDSQKLHMEHTIKIIKFIA